MLILAAITILALTGENGLFSRAKEARTETQTKSEEEQIKLEVMASWDIDGNLNFSTLCTNLEHLQDFQEVSGSSFPITVTFNSGNSYKVASDGSIASVSSSSQNRDQAYWEEFFEIEDNGDGTCTITGIKYDDGSRGENGVGYYYLLRR